MRTLRFFPYMLAALGLAVVAGCGDDNTPNATLRVENRSDFSIVEIHLTPVDNPSFGPNLLAGDVLLPGESLTLGVDCGVFDALLVDSDGVDCQLSDLDLCFNDADWIIHN